MFRICRAAYQSATRPKEAKAEIRDAIEFHLAGMREDSSPIPKPSSRAEYVEVEQAAGGDRGA
jgi:predicted RNase H-like HicB family nuclease